MSKFLKTGLLLTGLLGLSSPVLADTISYSGSIDGSEPTFDHSLSAATTFTSYDTVSFTVDVDGVYSFISTYPGDTDADENFDGILVLYEVSFDPLQAAQNILGSDDDYSAGDVASLAAFDADCVGSNCSGFDATLTAGTTYILVQAAFTDVPNTFGQPTGDYNTTITGGGNISLAPVPVPAAIWLFASCLAGLGLFKRK